MGRQANETKPIKHICAGLLAHVDAGKTTLAEAILYLAGSIRKLGRVDHQDAFLDTDSIERARGITIFSKQAQLEFANTSVTLLDTPGHVDFSAEMERTLKVLDYAVLVISAADGVQSHVRTLWSLLKRYGVPVFLFVNKMDQPGADGAAVLKELKEQLDDGILDFGSRAQEEFWEEMSMLDEDAMEEYLEKGTIGEETILRLIRERVVFPCYFGSALKMFGVEELLEGIDCFTRAPEYGAAFKARVFKITRDEQGNRLTHLKITGGTLQVKEVLKGGGEHPWEEKVDQIRIFQGAGYTSVKEAKAGTICAVVGLSQTIAGEALGEEEALPDPVLLPVLSYRIELPEGCDVLVMLKKLKELEEEVPELHIVWNEELREIHVQVMGEVQLEILKSMIHSRFGVDVEFGQGNIVYKETITVPVEGVGHFEPLRHYAEVHLLLEPTKRGSGLQFASDCSEDLLDRNWQRLILTHLAEKQHRGVLTGAEITDMRITLIAGKAHTKHTEGGDFRQATYRAVRQGLRMAESILLEPYYDFLLEVPQDKLGRAMSDVQRMEGEFEPPAMEGEWAILKGSAPVATIREYQREVISYTGGRGKLSLNFHGYEPCHNAEEVIQEAAYDPEADLENPTGSVFCSHGAGFVVPWNEVPDYMHIQSGWKEEKQETEEKKEPVRAPMERSFADDKELREIFERTYGPVKRKQAGWERKTVRAASEDAGKRRPPKSLQSSTEYLLVDGYNIIFAWDELKELAKTNMAGARSRLMDVLSNYQGYTRQKVILVFDAYKVEGNQGEVLKYHNIHVIFTKEAETADQYIEKTVHEIGKKYQVTVATSDALEQVIILGQGAKRMSAKGLWEEILMIQREIHRDYLDQPSMGGKDYLLSHLPEEAAAYMEEIRLGRRSFGEGKKLDRE